MRRLLSLCVCLVAAAYRVSAQDPAQTVADGVYTDVQANRGAAVYDTACSNCHRPDLSGTNNGPALKEQRFARDFAGKDLKTLYTKISTTMPRNAVGTLSETAYLDIVSYILQENGFPPGDEDLTTESID